MTTERTSHRINETGDIFCASEDEWVEASAKRGWTALYNWGKEGWDIGGAYVTASWRPRFDDDDRTTGLWDACVSVEGDLTIKEGLTVVERNTWLDTQAVWHWLAGQSSGPVQDHVDAGGNPTPDNQNWQHRIRLPELRLLEHLTCRDTERLDDGSYRALGHFFWDLPATLSGTTLWDIHEGAHASMALRQDRKLTDEELVGWMDPDWRGPFSWARCDAAKEGEAT